WGQCAGQGYTGPTNCESPYTCVYSNPWYSQVSSGYSTPSLDRLLIRHCSSNSACKCRRETALASRYPALWFYSSENKNRYSHFSSLSSSRVSHWVDSLSFGKLVIRCQLLGDKFLQ
ncbi:carbohydrate-binding module family 1 protein, partial [Tulasnella calospora MUT 4182]